jgi:hypothetical protein
MAAGIVENPELHVRGVMFMFWSMDTPKNSPATVLTLPPLSSVDVFAMILDHLIEAVGARLGFRPWTQPMVGYLQARLRRISQRFLALAARIQTGKTLPGRARRPRKGPVPEPGSEPWSDPGGDSEAAAHRPRRWRAPVRNWFSVARFGWLRDMVPYHPGMYSAEGCGTQLRYLLTDPEMVALLAARPLMARLLRPLCWMLGVDTALLSPPSGGAAAAPRPGYARRFPEDDFMPSGFPGPVPRPDDDPGG